MSSPEKIIILDFLNNDVYILDYDSNQFHNIEDFFFSEEIINSHITINNCEYMVVPSSQLNLKFKID